jgi:hypothetical protein
MAIATPGLARLLGGLGARTRWSKFPPGSPERAAQTAHMRAGIRRRWIERAEAQAAEQGLTLTPTQIERSADALYQAALAHRRLKAYRANQARKAAQS